MPEAPQPGAARFARALVILVDGARADVVAKLAEAGELPVLRRHFVDAGGFRTATSVFPSVSGPAHLPVLTGAHPGRANLPGIRWAERAGRWGFLGRTRSYMAPFRAGKLERDVPSGVMTLFQHVEGLADVNTWFVRGCAGRRRRTRLSKSAAFVRSLISKDWYSSDGQAERGVLGALRAGFPSVCAVFPAVDELGHRFGPLSEECLEAYRRFDRSVGRVMDALARDGHADDTLVMITSDHGQTATETHLGLERLVGEVYPKTLAYPVLWRHLFDAEAAVMVSGNAMANVYLCGARGWSDPPDFGAGRPAELVARLLAEPGVDHVIHRGGQGGYVVVGRRGRTLIEVVAADDAGAPPSLRVRAEGEDPLGCGLLPPSMSKLEALVRTANSAYPDAPWQVHEFFRASRAGDLVVCAHPGFDLRAGFEYQPHRGSHGALLREHMLVPALVNARWQGGLLRSVDLFPSLLSALGKAVPRDIDGEAVAVARV